jgi:putative flippase GtrA/glycosyltransferase involved in cell wall biosynthesis
LVATLPLPAVVVPDLARVRQLGQRVAGQLSDSGSPSDSRSRGRHAAPKQPVLPKVFDGSRFVLFSAIGGVVFLLGFGLQAWLTSGLHVLPAVSYLAQAVLSIETSFVLNRWLTWRDRDTPLWQAFARFNVQKTVTVALNLALYVGLLWLGMNYLVANVVLTALFTIVNFVAGDRFVFVPAASRLARGGHKAPQLSMAPAAQFAEAAGTKLGRARATGTALEGRGIAEGVAVAERSCPLVSVVIPCRGNEKTIGAAVRSLLAQDYPGLAQIILVGSPGETTWDGLTGISDRRLVTLELETPPGLRDANYKRNAGITSASGDLIALVDSDIVLPADWMSRAVTALENSDVSCVAGGMRSIHDSYWGRYTDSTRLGAKTPRIDTSYAVTKSSFGARGRKPPITANALFTREMYAGCPIDASWSHGSYEDYEWFWRVVSAGYAVLVSQDLFGWHHHRRGMRPLVKEYLRSSRGCAYFIRAHLDCPFSRRRLCQAIGLPILAIGAAIVAAMAVTAGYGTVLGVLALSAVVGFAVDQVVQSRRLESLAYPLTGLALGLVFTTGLITNLIRARTTSPVKSVHVMASRASEVSASPGISDAVQPPETMVPLPETMVPLSEPLAPAATKLAVRQAETVPAETGPAETGPAETVPAETGPAETGQRGWWRALPLAGICVVQAVLSLTLVWSNTAFTDEADYLWIGRLLLGNWLHGTSWPASYGEQVLSGSPILYPPLGALADSLGGLAGARLLSLVFMLGATVLLYFTASRLLGRTSAIFACALWALTEPVIRLAFATYDPLSILLTALSAWLVVQASYRRRHGEFVAAAALALALANATAYSMVIIDPVVIAFAFFTWRPKFGRQQASVSAAWLFGAFCVFFAMILTVSRSWAGIFYTVFARNVPDHEGSALILIEIWSYAGLIIVLAAIGGLVGSRNEDWRRAGLLGLAGAAALFVPAAQIYYQTDWSLDKHLAYGIWFAAMAAGYGCSKLIRWLPTAKRRIAVVFCVVALTYPAITAWQAASSAWQGWPNATAFVTAFRPWVENTNGLIYVSGQEHIAQYYSPQVVDWTRWNTQLSLDPGPASPTVGYYAGQLKGLNYGLIVLFYSTSFSSGDLPYGILTSRAGSGFSTKLLSLVGTNSGDPGLRALTLALERDSKTYKLVSTGPYDSGHNHAVFAIWQRQSAVKTG